MKFLMDLIFILIPLSFSFCSLKSSGIPSDQNDDIVYDVVSDIEFDDDIKIDANDYDVIISDSRDVNNQHDVIEVCNDEDGDQYGEGNGCLGEDCNDYDINNWRSCGLCVDGDSDNYYTNCDRYETINGPDCDDDDNSIYPLAKRICSEKSIDYDCNGYIDNYEGCNKICESSKLYELREDNFEVITPTINKIFVAGNYAYVAGDKDENSFVVLDVSASSFVDEIESFNIGKKGLDLFALNNYLYLVTPLTDTKMGLHIFNIIDPLTVSYVSYNTNFDANSVFIYSNYLIAGQTKGDNNLQIFSLVTPETPFNVSQGTAGDNVNDLVIIEKDDTIYAIAAVNNHLEILQKNEDKIEGIYSSEDLTENDILSIYYYVSRQKLYLVDGAKYIVECNISEFPEFNCNKVEISYKPQDVLVRDDYIFLSTFDGLVIVYDINFNLDIIKEVSINSCNTIFVTDTDLFVGCSNVFYRFDLGCCVSITGFCTDNSQCCSGDCNLESNICF